jgi:hypothetical protein
MSMEDTERSADGEDAPALGANRLPTRLTVRDDDGPLYDPSRSLTESVGRLDGL